MDQNSKIIMEDYFECIPPSNELKEIIETAKDWALLNGLCIRPSNFDKDSLQFQAITLLPSSFPRKVYSEACEIQTSLNELTHKVAHDYDFLKNALEETTKVDFFTKKLFDLYETVRKEGLAQEISLGMFRSDYLLDVKKSLKQVEMNTIACGCGWLGACASKLHKFILQEMGMRTQVENIPENHSLQELCLGMIEAWELYGDKRAGILFLVEIENETYNICDQRAHEFEIKRVNPNIKVIRKTLTELVTTAKLGDNKELLVGDSIISVVYFRCGYKPSHYPTVAEWNVRLMIERSKAIKCPSIHYHLAGTKKVQQVLTQPGMVERYLKDSESASRVRKIFTEMYSLDFTIEGDKAIEMALENPEDFVLKPQREGGGNNIFTAQMESFLKTMKEKKERTSWILMDKIHAVSQKNYFIRPGNRTQCEEIDTVSELGVFGVIIGNSRTIFSNKEAGYLVRSKPANSNEGGISFEGAVSSIYLV